MSISRLKSILAVLIVAAIAGMVPLAHATTPAFPVVIAGSSAMFNTMALGAYNAGNGPAGAVPPTFHWTSGSNKLSLKDCRPQTLGATACNEDAASVWVVWDSSTATSGPNVWVYAKVDSVVGDRCFFAQPHCTLHDLASGDADWVAAGSNKIADPCSSTPGNLWGDSSCDTTLPGNVLAIVESQTLDIVNVAATDIRPEDAAWAIARVNSAAGASTAGGANSDGTDGLGYNSSNPAGRAPQHTCPAHITLAQLQGTPIYSGYGHTGTSTDNAAVLAFNITGTDPATCTAVPTYTIANVGASPIVFVNSRLNTLANLTNATEHELNTVFSGTRTDADVFKSSGLSSGNINAFLREPLSGTYNTTEATVMRYPTTYSATSTGVPKGVEGLSQELNTVCTGTLQNPLAGQACTVAAGAGSRWRGIGTSEVVTAVTTSNTNSSTGTTNPTDGIAYTFFSYGNVGPLADSASYGYIQLDGVDPIFQTYNFKFDQGQPSAANGRIPGATETTFPTCEHDLWSNGFSFPNVRNGTYRAWSLLHLIYNSTQNTPVKNLVAAGNIYAVTTVPDYIPAAKVTATGIPALNCSVTSITDLGLLLVRSHYAQFDGNSVLLGTAPVCATVSGVVGCTGATTSNTTGGGGDMGGMIIPTALGASAAYKTYLTQSGDANGGLGPGFRH